MKRENDTRMVKRESDMQIQLYPKRRRMVIESSPPPSQQLVRADATSSAALRDNIYTSLSTLINRNKELEDGSEASVAELKSKDTIIRELRSRASSYGKTIARLESGSQALEAELKSKEKDLRNLQYWHRYQETIIAKFREEAKLARNETDRANAALAAYEKQQKSFFSAKELDFVADGSIVEDLSHLEDVVRKIKIKAEAATEAVSQHRSKVSSSGLQ